MFDGDLNSFDSEDTSPAAAADDGGAPAPASSADSGVARENYLLPYADFRDWDGDSARPATRNTCFVNDLVG